MQSYWRTTLIYGDRAIRSKLRWLKRLSDNLLTICFLLCRFPHSMLIIYLFILVCNTIVNTLFHSILAAVLFQTTIATSVRKRLVRQQLLMVPVIWVVHNTTQWFKPPWFARLILQVLHKFSSSLMKVVGSTLVNCLMLQTRRVYHLTFLYQIGIVAFGFYHLLQRRMHAESAEFYKVSQQVLILVSWVMHPHYASTTHRVMTLNRTNLLKK